MEQMGGKEREKQKEKPHNAKRNKTEHFPRGKKRGKKKDLCPHSLRFQIIHSFCRLSLHWYLPVLSSERPGFMLQCQQQKTPPFIPIPVYSLRVLNCQCRHNPKCSQNTKSDNKKPKGTRNLNLNVYTPSFFFRFFKFYFKNLCLKALTWHKLDLMVQFLEREIKVESSSV